MPVVIVLAFVFFVILDILIFMRMWNLVVIVLAFGVSLVVVGLIFRIFLPAKQDKSGSQAAAPMAGTPDRKTQVMTGQSRSIEPSRVPAGKSGLGFFGVIFIIESIVVVGLLVYLFLR